MSNRFAIVLTCTQGLIENVTAAFNGIELYGNKVDIHLLSKDMDKDYIKALPSNYIVPDWKTEVVDPNKPKHKGGGWEVRYYRYTHIRKIKEQYDAVMTLDADVFVVGNFMEHFERAYNEGVLIMPDNPRGIPANRAALNNVKGAASPPYHCHPFFFDPKKYDYIMADLYKWGLEEDYGDMATLYRTLYRHGIHQDVVTLPNDLYCFTDWHFDNVEKTFDEQNRLILKYKGEQMVVVHRRWANKNVRDKFVGDLGDKHREWGTHNVQTFKESIDWLNTNGSIKFNRGQV